MKIFDSVKSSNSKMGWTLMLAKLFFFTWTTPLTLKGMLLIPPSLSFPILPLYPLTSTSMALKRENLSLVLQCRITSEKGLYQSYSK